MSGPDVAYDLSVPVEEGGTSHEAGGPLDGRILDGTPPLPDAPQPLE
jgi:hypothetical protein